MSAKIQILYFALGVALTVLLFVGAVHLLNTSIPFAAVTSGSMTPSIKQGDLLVVQGVNTSSLRVGDIIVYCSTDTALKDCKIVHRIIQITLENGQPVGFITKGDNNLVADNVFGFEPSYGIPPSHVLGKVVFVVPLLGFLVIFLKQPIGFVSVVLVLVASITWDLYRKPSDEDYDKTYDKTQEKPDSEPQRTQNSL
jgi:signal peptidase